MIAPRIMSLYNVYKTGSFTKAAEVLGLTQPAVSQHISLLETELGIKIFDRSHNPFKLTEEGQKVVDCVIKIIDLVEDLNENLEPYREKSEA